MKQIIAFTAAGIFLIIMIIAGLSQDCDSAEIYGCVAKKEGSLRIVSNASQCTLKETAISWNQVGPQGPEGPAGTTGGTISGTIGYCGSTGAGYKSVYILGESFMATTTPQGNFKLSYVPTGTYDLSIDWPGSLHHTRKGIEVIAGQDTQLGTIKICCPAVTTDPSCICYDGATNVNGVCIYSGGNTPHVVFVSSQRYSGNMGGLAGADAKCQALADAAGLPGTFKAWLSDSAQGPADRFTHAGGYVRPDGVLIASTWEELTSGRIRNVISIDENRNTNYSFVWTSTTPQGQYTPCTTISTDPITPINTCDCGGWRSEEFTPGIRIDLGTVGCNAPNGCDQEPWTMYTPPNIDPCMQSFPIYCFQQ